MRARRVPPEPQPMPTTSFFCEHKRLRSTCLQCRASAPLAGPAPATAAPRHDPDATWHALRLECHRRIARLLEAARAPGWERARYDAIYDAPRARMRDETDPATFEGAFYLAFVKMFDV